MTYNFYAFDASLFLTLVRYVTFGIVWISSITPNALLSNTLAVMSAVLSFLSPNTIALVGQAVWQAVTTSPSFRGRFSFLAVSLPSCIRCTQNEHFSITPRERTVTSGLSTIPAGP